MSDPNTSSPSPSDGRRRPYNVPTPVSTLVGRSDERAEVLSLLRHQRLTTLCGPPGVGKTRLAVEVALAAANDHPRGAWWVDLAPVTDPGGLAVAMARAMGVHEQPGTDLFRTLLYSLEGCGALVVLDNCEHLVEPVSSFAQALLEGRSDLTLLATSRQALGVVGEHHYEVLPLSVPEPDANAAAVAATDAGWLFYARAQSVQPTFELDGANTTAVGEICRRLDGIPLAVELAAGRVGVLSATEIASRLDDCFALLGGTLRSFWGRQQTLAETLAWSYELLSVSEQALLRRLAVFPSDFTFEALEAVSDGSGTNDETTLDLLASLVAKSLVVARTKGAPARYRLLETVRAFAREQLDKTDEVEAVVARHGRWYLALVEEAAGHLTGPRQVEWLERLDADHHNLSAAFDWSVTQSTDEALALSGSLTLWWRMRGRYSEGRHCLEAALEHCPDGAESLRAGALWGLGFMALMLLDTPAAEDALAGSLALYRRLEDESGQARTFLLVGNAAQPMSPEKVRANLDRSIAMARAADDSWCLAHALALSGQQHLSEGATELAGVALDEALAVARTAKDAQSLLIALLLAGDVALGRGDHRQTEVLSREGQILSRSLGDSYGEGAALSRLAAASVVKGDYPEAARLLEECLSLPGFVAAPRALTHLLALRARVAFYQGDLRGAELLLTRADAAMEGHQATDLVWAEVLLAVGDFGGARRLLEEALLRSEEDKDRAHRAEALALVAEVDRMEGRHDQAESHHRQALELRDEIGNAHGILRSIEALANLAAEAGQAERAVRLLAAGKSLRAEGGYSIASEAAGAHDLALERVRSVLPSDLLETAWRGGAALTMREATTYALRGRGRRHGRALSGWGSLTRSELDVVRLVAQGLTNNQIASHLFVSNHAVKKHVGSALAKLNLASRVELATEATRRRL